MRILIVEDEQRIAKTLKKGLEQEHHTVDVCFDGEEGFDLASTEDYDLIVLDRMLPKMDGMLICKELRNREISTPILMLTAKSQILDRIEGLDAGADDYLTKPFSFEELLARLRALTRRPKAVVTELLKVGELELNIKSHQTTREKQEIILSAKEFSILEYLVRNAPMVLTKDQIIAHVWNFDTDILPNTIEVYIKNLRSKVDKPFPHKKPLINTVRGFGYRIGN